MIYIHIHHKTKQNEPVLTIGNCVLTGKIEKLKKPLLITSNKSHFNQQRQQRELKVFGVIKYKYIFGHRPKIVLLHSSPKNRVIHISQIK